jgi:hypothetical protein
MLLDEPQKVLQLWRAVNRQPERDEAHSRARAQVSHRKRPLARALKLQPLEGLLGPVPLLINLCTATAGLLGRLLFEQALEAQHVATRRRDYRQKAVLFAENTCTETSDALRIVVRSMQTEQRAYFGKPLLRYAGSCKVLGESIPRAPGGFKICVAEAECGAGEKGFLVEIGEETVGVADEVVREGTHDCVLHERTGDVLSRVQKKYIKATKCVVSAILRSDPYG